DPYALLGIARTARAEDVEHAYRRLAMAVHPDHADADDPAAVAAATRAFVALGEARDLLHDPLRRREWDRAHPVGHASSGPGRKPPPPPHKPPSAHPLRTSVAGVPVLEPMVGRGRTFGRRTTHLQRGLPGLRLCVEEGTYVPPQVLGDGEVYEVILSGAIVRAVDLREMIANRSIRRVNLSDTRVGDEEVARLCTMPRLEVLRLDGTAITDACCRDLSRAPSLREVSLQNTQIGDVGVRDLARSTSIRTIELRGTNVTRTGLHALDRMKLDRIVLPHLTHRLEEHRLRRAHPGLMVT
ncbi:MAG TPA: DnaJ domain-containing protein, partial [Acidimicrobiales bacterium]|nr:DnaJ domain-containing protein [Acidimicrobiales bacterium]